MSARTKREREVRAVYSRMQRSIDASMSLIWDQYFGEVARVNPHGSSMRFSAKFNEAWRRSNLPNSERDDMNRDGNYVTTGTS